MEEIYIGTKIVRAEPLDEKSFYESRGGQWLDDRPTRDGYRVVYDDGYVSWSPKETFERSYRKVTYREAEMVHGAVFKVMDE